MSAEKEPAMQIAGGGTAYQVEGTERAKALSKRPVPFEEQREGHVSKAE